jgi:hypothetical protein
MRLGHLNATVSEAPTAGSRSDEISDEWSAKCTINLKTDRALRARMKGIGMHEDGGVGTLKPV